MKKIISSGLFSFLGAALAVYFSSYFEQENWNARFTLEQKKNSDGKKGFTYRENC